jgi:Mlc titration factor MtfA (ptsG expression regulator)
LKAPFPPEWRAQLERDAPFYRALSSQERARLEDSLRIFMAEKTFLGAGGLEITPEIKLLISASAARLVLHLDIERFARLREIIVYPSAYQRLAEDSVYLGEAHQWGVVVLAWDSVLEGLRRPNDGHDTTLHELAHVLDRASGSFDGTPALRARADIRPWALVMSQHYLRLRANRAPENQVLDGYGAKNEAEFFAVATEVFFERPEQLEQKLPALYRELARFYGGEDEPKERA